MLPDSCFLFSVCGKRIYTLDRDVTGRCPALKQSPSSPSRRLRILAESPVIAGHLTVWPGGWVARTVKCPKGRPVSGTAYCHGCFWHPGLVDEAACESAGGATRIYYCPEDGKPSVFLHLSDVSAGDGTLGTAFFPFPVLPPFCPSFFVIEAATFGSPFIRPFTCPFELQIAPFENTCPGYLCDMTVNR